MGKVKVKDKEFDLTDAGEALILVNQELIKQIRMSTARLENG